MTDELLVERRDDALWLTMNRPARSNAFDPAMIAAFERVLRNVSPEMRAVVLTGTGERFSAGADLDWMTAPDLSPEEALRSSRTISDFFRMLDATPIPLVARVNGPAVGGGVALAAIADVTVASDGAAFQLSEVLVGLVPAMAAPYLIRRIGPGRTREWTLTAERIDARRAAEWGLVGTVVPAARLDEAVGEKLAMLRRASPEATVALKAFLRSVEGRSPEEAAEEAVRAIAERRTSGEARERAATFRNGGARRRGGGVP